MESVRNITFCGVCVRVCARVLALLGLFLSRNQVQNCVLSQAQSDSVRSSVAVDTETHRRSQAGQTIVYRPINIGCRA